MGRLFVSGAAALTLATTILSIGVTHVHANAQHPAATQQSADTGSEFEEILPNAHEPAAPGEVAGGTGPVGGPLGRIINGFDAPQTPWMASLRRVNVTKVADAGAYFCGGTLVHSRYVLTARHCLNVEVTPGPTFNPHTFQLINYPTINGVPTATPVPHTYLRIAIGGVALDRIDQFEWHEPESIICHPKMYQFDPVRDKAIAFPADQNPDICLIRLKRASKINPVALSRGAEGYEIPGAPVRAIGWGFHEYSFNAAGQFVGYKRPNTLKESTALVIEDPAVCSKKWQDQYARLNLQSVFKQIVGEQTVCAYDPSERTALCMGDSGGPLLTADRTVQLGVVSYGPSTCPVVNGRRSVLTKVAYFFDWIEDTIGEPLTPSRFCRSKVPHITSEWCALNQCASSACSWRPINWEDVIPKQSCVSISSLPGVTDEWCKQVQCDGAYREHCVWVYDDMEVEAD